MRFGNAYCRVRQPGWRRATAAGQLTRWSSEYSGRGSLRANVSPARISKSPLGSDARGVLGGLTEVFEDTLNGPASA
jgi:hypothetical protein